jgi:hypothetical protein
MEVHQYTWERLATGTCKSREQLSQNVIAMLNKGMTGRYIARTLKISEPTVSRIKHGDRQQETGGPILRPGPKVEKEHDR